VTLYHSYGTQPLSHFSTEAMVWSGNRDSSGGCLYNKCSN